MKKLMAICMVLLFVSGLSYGAVEVRETVDGTTYTYTLTNNTNSTIWNWAVWFTENPNPDPDTGSVTTDTEGWVCTNVDTQGYFPQEYNVQYEVIVTNSEGEALKGPDGEPGFYQTYAGNFTSANPKEYDQKYDAWLGAKFGWDGYGADIKTNVGIGPGETGTLKVENPIGDMTGAKSFSYNTTDYWYSKTCLSNDDDMAYDFEGDGTVLPYDADPTTVTEADNGDGTYTYTLTNNTVSTIWNWAVWFDGDPEASTVTTDMAGWECPFESQGYFPEEYVAFWDDVDEVLDSDGVPLLGPAIEPEPGFYQVYAGDFVSANPKKYDKDLDVFLGGESGWDGYDADIRTNYGIAPGETGTLVIEDPEGIVSAKSFSYNTTDYWYSMTSWDGPTITTIWCDFEAHGVVE